MTQNLKDWMHYGSALGMLVSCVVLSFISFLTIHLVHSTVLMYTSICVMFAAGVYGITLYFRNSLGEFGTEMKNSIRDVIGEELEKHQKEMHQNEEESQ